MEKAPGQNWEKMINLTSKLGEIYDIEHNKGSEIYPQNQVIFLFIGLLVLLQKQCAELYTYRGKSAPPPILDIMITGIQIL